MRTILVTIIFSLVITSLGTAAEPLKQCLAVRGNGHRAPVSFAAISRITEQFGVVDAIQGSSSGSIVVYLYESMTLNPELKNCDGKPCTDEQLANRMVLLLKSLIGLGRHLLDLPHVQRVVGTDAENEIKKPGPRGIVSVLFRPNLRKFIRWRTLFPNPKVLFNFRKHFQRIGATLNSLGFDGEKDREVLLREGLINFNHLLYMSSMFADFYAGYGPEKGKQERAEKWSQFLNECSADSKGILWTELGARKMSSGRTCNRHFQKMLGKYRKTYRRNTKWGEWVEKLKTGNKSGGRPYKKVWKRFPQPEMKFHSRRNDIIGENGNTFVTSSIVEKKGIRTEFENLKSDYLNFKDVVTPTTWIDGFGIGWWGDEQMLGRVDSAIAAKKSSDRNIKEKTFRNLGRAKWADVIYASASEPGMTPARTFPGAEDMITTGGWVDNQAGLMMKNMGCEKTIYVTSVGAVLGFARNAYASLGATEEQREEMFSPTEPGSGYYESIKNSDVIWCTDWNDPKISLKEMVYSGYDAPVWVRPGVYEDFAQSYKYANNGNDRLTRIGCYDPSVEGLYPILENDI